MKAELITKKEFQPVTIQLTFETQEEYNAFYNVMVSASGQIYNATKGNCGLKYAEENHWASVSDIIYKTLKRQ